jgi:adenine-specific DNA-methyltransferase
MTTTTTATGGKLKMHTPDLTTANIAKLAELFPNCVTEAKDEKTGQVKQAIDFDQLRQELSDHVVDGPRERFHLDWPGKREALLAANAPISKTLRPVRNESIAFETTKNLFIEGDNLDALKLLQETYLNKIKMIYIDPPYNTGKEFIYDDDFSDSPSEYYARSGQVGDLGGKLVANTEANGRFHSDWLSMMFPRLKLARTLLTPDGVIFISIDDTECASLRRLCDEVFGEENFVANIIWQHSVQPKGYTDLFSVHHNHLLCYRRSDTYTVQPLDRTEENNKNYGNPDNDPRGPWRSGDVRNAMYRPNLIYKIKTPSGKYIDPPENGWRWSSETLQAKIDSGEISFSRDETRIIRKIYLSDQTGRAPETIWFSKDVGDTRSGAQELKELFDGVAPFDTVKPTALIDRMFHIAGLGPSDICLDFFAGSCSTAHARMVSELLGPFIMIQIAEPVNAETPHGKAALALRLNTVAEVGKERLRRASKKMKSELELSRGKVDVGFRVLKIDASNMKDVYFTPDATTQTTLSGLVDNVKEDRTDEDLLFQVLLDWGVDLTLPITSEKIKGKRVYFVDTNALAACFEAGIDEGFIKELAKRKPLRAVFRDNGFGTDATKINVEQIFKLLSPGTDVKSI